MLFSFQSISFALLLLNLFLSVLFDAVINGIVSCFFFMLYIEIQLIFFYSDIVEHKLAKL